MTRTIKQNKLHKCTQQSPSGTETLHGQLDSRREYELVLKYFRHLKYFN